MDSEDLELLKDIALIDQQLQIRTTDFESEDSGDEVATPPSQIDAHTPKELNFSCQRVLRDMENNLLRSLEENQDKQKTILKYLGETNKKCDSIDDSNMRRLIRCAGIPYFKDFYGYPQPRNEDVKEKLSYGELLCADFLTYSSGWSKHDKICLTKAVLNDGKKKVGKGGKSHSSAVAVKSNNQVDVEKTVDWLKISASDMNGKYSATECESQWKLHLSPNVNKQKWSESEITNLNILAKKFKYQDWDKIATELGTKRSGYQCCIQYQSKNSLNEGKWTLEENALLKSFVEKFKINNQVPWTKISWFFQTRSRKQCRERYLEHLRKDLKKGTFSPAEDKIIIAGAKIFKDFGKLAKFLPGRVPTQIRSRYYYLIGTKMSGFTEEEDKLLLSLVKERSNNWLSISQNFPNRSKLQCRKRYAALCREKVGDSVQKFREDIRDCKKVTEKANSMKRRKPEGGKHKGKGRTDGKMDNDERDVHNELIGYHENCSENYFGPRMRNPASEEELKNILLKLRATMAMLSVSCDFSKKTEQIESLKNNSNFSYYDKKLLNKLAEEDASSGSCLKENYLLHGMLIPPNRNTLTGYHTISSSRKKIRLRTCEAEGLPQTSMDNPKDGNSGERLSFSKAKALFKSRMRSIFFLPFVLSKIQTSDLSQEVFHKSKRKKAKKMTKKRLRDRAREMNAAYQEKRRKMTEGTTGSDHETFESAENTVENNGSTPTEEALPKVDNESTQLPEDNMRRSLRKRKI